MSEGLLAERTSERPLACVLPEVISQVAALLENTLAAFMLALEVKLYTLSTQILHLDSLVPVFGHPLEGF